MKPSALIAIVVALLFFIALVDVILLVLHFSSSLILMLILIFSVVFGWWLIKFKRRYFYLSIVISFMYVFAVSIFNSVSSNRIYAHWTLSISELNLVESLATRFVSQYGQCPYLQQLIDLHKIRIDKSIRIYLTENRCIIYHLGPDGIDDKAKVRMNDNAIRFLPQVYPWSVMFGGNWINRLGGDSTITKGDFVREIVLDK